MEAAQRKTLEAIQALRGVAAVAVILYHVARHLAQAVDAPVMTALFLPGHNGVDLFFVLSGFIIVHVHGRDIGRPERLGRYASARFRRLMPIYWIALALTAVGHVLVNGHVPLGHLLWSATLLPTEEEPLLGIAWTLQHELLFYAAFALLIWNRRVGMAAMLLWVGWIGVVATGLVERAPPERLYSAYNLEFLFGAGAALLLARGQIAAPRLWTLVGGGMLGLVCVLEMTGRINGYGDAARLAVGIPSAILIAGLAAWEQRRAMAVPRGLRLLGEASYSLYLFQLLSLGVAWQMWERSGLDAGALLPLCFAWLAVATVAGAFVAWWAIERPLMDRLRGRPGPFYPWPLIRGEARRWG